MTLNIELERFGADLTRSRVEPSSETEQIELVPRVADRTVTTGKWIPTLIKVKLISVLQE